MIIDDSELFHGTYDPVKAREYYLRTRKLKGRRPGAAKPTGGARSPAVRGGAGGKPNRADTKSRRAELEAQKKALEKRLDHLREVLAERVKEAKKNSHKNAPKHQKDGKAAAAPETKVDKADRNKAEKSRKPLTAHQKSVKAKAAKKAYEKEHPTSLSHDIDILHEQIKDIRAKIQKAISDAQAGKHKVGANQQHTSPTSSHNKPSNGSKGR